MNSKLSEIYYKGKKVATEACLVTKYNQTIPKYELPKLYDLLGQKFYIVYIIGIDTYSQNIHYNKKIARLIEIKGGSESFSRANLIKSAIFEFEEGDICTSAYITKHEFTFNLKEYGHTWGLRYII